jgi:hypothetical protein
MIDDGSGCTAISDSTEVTSEGPPAIVTLDGPANICSSGTVTLSTITGAGYTYQWFLDGSAIAGATAFSYTTSVLGAYYVEVIADGCNSTSVTINVVNETPVSVISTAGDLDICVSGSVSLNCTTTGVGYSYQWLKDSEPVAGAITVSLFALDTGSYQAVVYNTFGCGDTSDALIVFTSCPDTVVNPGFNNISNQLSAVLFPNPADANIQVQTDISSTIAGIYQISILNLTGTEMLRMDDVILSAGQQLTEIDLTGLSGGLYYLRMSNSSGHALYPFVKN